MLCEFCSEPEDDCYCDGLGAMDINPDDLAFGFHVETPPPGGRRMSRIPDVAGRDVLERTDAAQQGFDYMVASVVAPLPDQKPRAPYRLPQETTGPEWFAVKPGPVPDFRVPDEMRRLATDNGWGEGVLNGQSVLVPPRPDSGYIDGVWVPDVESDEAFKAQLDASAEAVVNHRLRDVLHDAGFKSGNLRSGNPKDRVGDTKPPLHLVPAALGIYAAQAMKNGAEKYGPFNWREHPVQAHVYVAAALRHIAAWYDGEDDAQDSGVHHLAHAAAGLAILLDAMATGNLIDDRPTPGAAARLIAEFS